MSDPTKPPDARRPREALRRPESYASVHDWYEDYRGYVPIQMAHALSKLTASGMSFHDAYLLLLGKGAIIEIEPRPRDQKEG